MDLLALLPSPRARANLRLAMPRLPFGSRRGGLRFLDSWEDVEGGVGGGFTGLVVVDPLALEPRPSPVEELAALRERLGGGGLVLYGGPWRGAEAILDELARAGFRILLTVGVDDEPRALLRALAAAFTCRRLGTLAARLGLDPASSEAAILGAALGHWPRATTSEVMARRLGFNDRTLRRFTRTHGLPSPSKLLRAACLLDALALRELGIRSASAIPPLLGYSSASSLGRCFRALTGRDLEELMGFEDEEDWLAAVLGALRSA